jgi:hypothetical protein
LKVRFVIWASHRVHLELQELTLVVPLGIHIALAASFTAESSWIIHILWECLLSKGWYRTWLLSLLTLSSGCLCSRPRRLSLAADRLTAITTLLAGLLLVVMDALHVVKQVVSPGESISWNTSFTSRVEAEVGAITMTMHPVCLSFMAEQTSSGGELLLGTSLDLASEGFDMRVNELAAVRCQCVCE